MKVYVVGGAVRDTLLGKVPKDYDYVVVGATAQELLEKGFKQVGADFPVFLHPDTGDEWALARLERKTGTGYLGFTVDAGAHVTLEEDLSRRDLTINAMAYELDNPATIIDPYGGLTDLRNKVLRHVSKAFSEDPLRVIRLARFYSRYKDFRVAPKTKLVASIIVDEGELDHLPTERFWAELTKVFDEDRPDRFFSLLGQLGADIHVKFFRELYGGFTRKALENLSMVSIATSLVDDPAERVMHHVALTAIDGNTLKMAPSRTQTLFKNVQNLRQLSNQRITANNVFDLLKQAKAWSPGDSIDDLDQAMQIAALTGERFAFTSDELWSAVEATSAVMSAKYPDIKGKALGEAIERGRKEAIARVFNLHDDPILVSAGV